MVDNGLFVAGVDGHFDSPVEPLERMFIPMSPDNVAVGTDLGGAFESKALFDIGPSQMNDEHIFVHRLVGLDPKVG